ncbi:hypothetical protein FS749_010551, partial [Ceratobasidium sp. UAMH 11750]
SEPSSDDYDYESDSDGGYDSSGRGKGDMMKFPCCGERFREDDEDKMMREPCVSAKHNTNPSQVEYYAGPVELPPRQKNGLIDFGQRYKRYTEDYKERLQRTSNLKLCPSPNRTVTQAP